MKVFNLEQIRQISTADLVDHDANVPNDSQQRTHQSFATEFDIGRLARKRRAVRGRVQDDDESTSQSSSDDDQPPKRHRRRVPLVGCGINNTNEHDTEKNGRRCCGKLTVVI